jgi:glycosyltransferase involved in cell wall biosynthesis
MDHELFHPRHRNRQRLQSDFGIPPERAVLLFVGRIDAGKDVMTPANAARALLDRSMDLHLICAGEGTQMPAVRQLLGPRVTLPGQVNENTLRWLYASADIFVFSSKIEVFPNVVLEAKASGLPVIVSAQGGSARLASQSGTEPDGIAVCDSNPAAWADTIAVLLNNPEKRRAMGEVARQYIENSWPTWQQVLREDLLPIWQQVARERRGRS